MAFSDTIYSEMGVRTAELLLQILANQEKFMAALDDLKAAVTALNTSVSNELAAITTKLASFGDTVTAADVETQVTALNSLKATLDSETAQLVPPAPPPPQAST